jgi:putative flippase GtrA
VSADRPLRNAPVRLREVVAFGVVGASAFVVHFGVVASIVPLGVPPLVANVVGFVVAFTVSFIGHGRWSFPAEGRPVGPALRRFAVVAISGFALNEGLYAVLLRFTRLDYRFALLLVLIGVAGLTWLANRHWAFAHRP